MNVSLTPELEDYIQKNVDSQMFQTASEVVRDALRLHKQRAEEATKIAELRHEIQLAMEQSKRGEGREFTRAVADEIIARGQQRLAARKGRR